MQHPSGESASPSSVARRARDLADAEYAAWLTDHSRSAWARHPGTSLPGIWRSLARRVDDILAHPMPAAANRAWLCEAVQAWAPLEVIFPSRLHPRDSGVTGELCGWLETLIEREYGHVVAGMRSVISASELLQADAQRLELQIACSLGLRPLLEPAEGATSELGGSAWPTRLIALSLGLAESSHRRTLGEPQVVDAAVLDEWRTEVVRIQQTCRAFERRGADSSAAAS